MKTLVIVDEQRDFNDPCGNLYVKGGEDTIPEIAKLIKEDMSINQVIFTVDWHTSEDHSFKKNGGQWNLHCVQYSVGASLPSELLDAVLCRGFKSIDGSYRGEEPEINKFFISNTYDVFQKGDIPDQEEYGAFGGSVEVLETDEDVLCMMGASGECCAYLNTKNDVIVCGLAGDYCVLETAKNLKGILEGEEGKLMMFMPGIKSIDGGTKLSEWMSEEGIGEYVRE